MNHTHAPFTPTTISSSTLYRVWVLWRTRVEAPTGSDGYNEITVYVSR